MDAELMMVEQAALLKAANPRTKVFVYRNNAKALPWLASIRKKLEDPQYSGWFLTYTPGGSLPNGSYYANPCDYDFSPAKCSSLYHDQVQSPGHPQAGRPEDGNCTAPCDCGSIPCGEYFWNWTNGTMLQTWFVNEHLLGPTGLANPNISGFYFDDGFADAVTRNPSDPWCSGSPVGGPTEADPHCWQDMGLKAPQTAAIHAALDLTFAATRNAVMDAKGFAWNYFRAVSLPSKASGPQACTKWFREDAHSFASTALSFSWTCEWCGVSPNDSRQQDLAAFLLVRGPFAWITSGWGGTCTGFMADPPWTPLLELEVGVPLTPYYNESGSSGVFYRQWSGAKVSFDCNTWEGAIEPSQGNIM